jgi:FtsZ-interacting cell division protein ZipA
VTHEELERVGRRRDVMNRLIGLAVVILLTALVWIGLLIHGDRDEAEQDAAALAEPVLEVCDGGGEPAAALEQRGACRRAEQLPDPDDPEQQDPENQDPENQDAEQQDPEIQDGDPNDPDPIDDPDPNDPDPADDPDSDDPEQQEPEIQDPEEQEPEIQEPEEQNAPVCPPGFTAEPFVWNGPDDLPNTGDERTWLLCMEDVP